jgi:cellulose synthase/poly-beta-1,6-N-acetylglucosamine synthase-like glycosyltransferase
LIQSPTYEEGAPTFTGWVRQRGRWIQGHIQTVSVHARTPWRLAQQLGGRGLMAFFLGMTAGPLNAVILFVSVLLALGQVSAGTSGYVFSWALLMGLSQAIMGIMAVMRNGRNTLWIACLAFPLYQACQVPALFRAIWRIYLSPSIWDKTKHGAEARSHRSFPANGQHAMSEPQTWIGQQL